MPDLAAALTPAVLGAEPLLDTAARHPALTFLLIAVVTGALLHLFKGPARRMLGADEVEAEELPLVLTRPLEPPPLPKPAKGQPLIDPDLRDKVAAGLRERMAKAKEDEPVPTPPRAAEAGDDATEDGSTDQKIGEDEASLKKTAKARKPAATKKRKKRKKTAAKKSSGTEKDQGEKGGNKSKAGKATEAGAPKNAKAGKKKAAPAPGEAKKPKPPAKETVEAEPGEPTSEPGKTSEESTPSDGPKSADGSTPTTETKAREDVAAVARRKRAAERKARRAAREKEKEDSSATKAGTESSGEEDLGVRSLADGLAKTRGGWISRLNRLIFGKKKVESDIMEDLEEILYSADIGSRTTARLVEEIEELLEREDLSDPERVKQAIQENLLSILSKEKGTLQYDAAKPHVVMVVGVNGVGKTTTIGKIASMLTGQGKSVMLAAADTFRAAAVEQLEIWADRAGAEIIRGKDGQDPSSVAFDAVKAAQSRGLDVVLTDTAGRLHTKHNLMEELKKVKRVMARAADGAPQDIILVLDATTGQNAINQARQFNEALGVTGLVLTKLDGTAKGGVVVAITDELGIPMRYIGVGEHVEDLKVFRPDEFVKALFT